MIYSSSQMLLLVGQLCWMSFFGFVAWIELRAVLRQKSITNEAISMSISVYLLFGLTWSFLYDVIYQLQPHAFAFNGTASPLVSAGEKVFPVLAYFSFVTLTTIGYGDITPLTLQARYAAVKESRVSFTSQFLSRALLACC